MIIDQCLTSCYNDLPQPELVLSPEDTELNYFLWMPGFKYQPTLKEKLTTLRSLSLNSDSTIEDVLEDLIEIDELECKFNTKAVDGFLTIDDAGVLAREMGAVPSQGDLLEFFATYGNNVNLEQFKELCAISVYSNEDKEFLLNTLNSFNDASGVLTVKKLEYVLRNYGEPLNDGEIKEVLKLLPVSGGNVKSSEFVDLLRA